MGALTCFTWANLQAVDKDGLVSLVKDTGPKDRSLRLWMVAGRGHLFWGPASAMRLFSSTLVCLGATCSAFDCFWLISHCFRAAAASAFWSEVLHGLIWLV